jgi:hypothetical protein
VTTAAIGRTCQVDACSERVPGTLLQRGVCLSHYLDDAFTRSAAALQLCQRGQRIDARTTDWLQSQGDFAVRLLAEDSAVLSLAERSRLLELLLCLTNIQEHVRRYARAKS